MPNGAIGPEELSPVVAGDAAAMDAGDPEAAKDGSQREGRVHKWLWALVVVSLGASAVLAAFLAETRAELDEQRRDVERAARQAEERVDAAASELVAAIESAGFDLRARQAEVDAIRRDLDNLESSLYGFGGAGFAATSIDDLEQRIDDLERCVTRNVNSLIYGNNFFYRC